MRKLVLKTKFSLGDVVMMTAAVRDLHRCCPNQFQTDVRTHFPEVWEHNPHITCLEERDPEVQTLDCRYPLINYADYRPYHCLHGYIAFLQEKLGVRIDPTEFRGDIHLSGEEKEWASQVHEVAGRAIPFWIVVAGGKHDLTIKWWSTERYQQVVNAFRGRIAFVQVGEMGHHHPKLEHTIDLRGQTNVRELVRLVYHAQGCLSGVTALMHLAAAVETQSGRAVNRPCVVVAGGREPPNWEAYPHHQFIHTVGSLACCQQGGCWRSRTLPLGDGDERDRPANLCKDVVGELPRCMNMIGAEEVIRRIELYFHGGTASYMSQSEAQAAARAVEATALNTYDLESLSRYNGPEVIQRAVERLPSFPEGEFEGRGIVICGGGLRYFPCAWVCIQMLRRVGCRLPVQLWYQGEEEMDRRMIELMAGLEVECIDARALEKRFPRRTSGGWELKAYALLHCRFKQVLLLDADNVPVKDPTYLFEAGAFKRTGSIFWPDYDCLAPDREIWKICDIAYRKESEFETGQILVDKEKCWAALNLSFWFNDHSDFFFDYIHGDKETFHMAWRKLGQRYTMIQTPIESLDGIMCQHDLKGARVFQHRNTHKWKLFSRNKRVRGFRFEKECLQYLKDLEQQWDGKIRVDFNQAVRESGLAFRGGTCDRGVFYEVCEKNEYQLPERFPPGNVIVDIGAHIGSFSYACLKRGATRVLAYEAERENFRLAKYNLQEFGTRVRLYQKAVWRSDRHPELLLHSGYPQGEGQVNTGGGTVLVAGEASPDHSRKELVETVSLDSIVQRFKAVHLLKLDCEGSEWPILLTSRQLAKVQRLCGDYHQFLAIPSVAQVTGYSRYTEKELAEFLKAHYKVVRVGPPGTTGLGHFWAEHPRPV